MFHKNILSDPSLGPSCQENYLRIIRKTPPYLGLCPAKKMVGVPIHLKVNDFTVEVTTSTLTRSLGLHALVHKVVVLRHCVFVVMIVFKVSHHWNQVLLTPSVIEII